MNRTATRPIGISQGRGDPVDGRLNNAAELRLFFALCVLVSHTIQLAGFSQYDIWRSILSSELAVQGFFILSGYLVMGSFERSTGWKDFYLRRLLRIYPAYAAAVFIFLLLSVLQAVALGRNIQWQEVPRYIVANLILLNFVQPGIGGLFEGQAFTEINGALWTIKLEVLFYTIVPFLYAMGRRWSLRRVAVVLILLGLAWRLGLSSLAVNYNLAVHPALAHQLPGQLHFFAVGILLFDASHHPHARRGHAMVLLAALTLAVVLSGPRLALQLGGLCVLIYVVSRLPQAPTPFSKHDLSYGVYLCHFPIIQLLIGAGLVTHGASLFLITVFSLATGYAWLSWRLIEAPALRLARRSAA